MSHLALLSENAQQDLRALSCVDLADAAIDNERGFEPDHASSSNDKAETTIAIQLKAMDIVLSVSSTESRRPRGRSASGTDASARASVEGNAISFHIDPVRAARCTQYLNEIDDPCRPSQSPLADPVVERLIAAFSAAQGSGGDFGEIYSDALRLAIITRLVSAQDGSSPEARVSRRYAPLPKWRLKRVLEYVDAHHAEKITLTNLAAVARLSRMHFAMQFRLATGMSPREFVLHYRIQLSQKMLMDTTESLVNIALAVGFQSQSHFTTVFRQYVGETPHRWRDANHGLIAPRRGRRMSPNNAAGEGSRSCI